jgi:hypothetical protein
MTSEAVVESATPTRVPSLDSIERLAQAASRRLRTRRAILWGAKALAGGLVAVLVLLILRKVGVIGERFCRVGLGLSLLQVLVVAGMGYARRLPLRAGAVALDRFHGLSDRLSSALSFADLEGAQRTPFMAAAIDDALVHARRVDPKLAVPMQSPQEMPFIAALGILLILLVCFEVREHKPVAMAATIDAVDVTQDDLDAMREFLREVDQRLQTDEAKAATQEFNQLIEDLANKRLDRTEAFRRMQQLEDKLLQGREADAKALEEALKKMGEELKKSEMSKPTGEALSDKNLEAAEKALKDLAKKLRDEQAKGGVDKQQLEKLREALKKASEDQAKRAEALAAKREELKQDLLKQRQKQGDAGANEQEKSLLQKKERELERLDREHEQQQKTQRELDRLDRELQKAAEDLMKDMGLSASDLDNAAQDINRMAKQEMTQEEKEQLRQKLQELREMMRQQSQGGAGQMQRLRVFQQRAQGQGGQSGQGGQQGQGQGQEGQGQQGQGQQGQGQQGQGQGQQAGNGQGQGQQGQGQGQGGQGGETWIVGPNGEKILMLTKGQGQGQGQGGGGGQGQQPGQGWGQGHDDNVQGKATNPKVGTQDTQVQGNDTGQGGSRSEVILGAAERGFASKGYTKVYREYHTVAEEALNKDEIPGGYRFYVRRYFQLIRPRDDSAGSAAPPPAPPTGP